MRKLTIAFLLLLTGVRSFAQQLPDEEPARGTRQWYLERSKGQKTGAWLLLGGGVVISLVGLGKSMSGMTLYGQQTADDKSKQRTGEVLFAVGLGCIGGSVPLFIAGARNKRKALAMSVKSETSYLPDPNQRRSFAAVSFRIAL